MKIKDKTLKIIFITIFLVIVVVLTSLLIWQFNINKVKNNNELLISTVVRNSIQQQADKNLLLPEFVFINADSSSKRYLTKNIIEQISNTLTKKYLTNDTIDFRNIEIKPFYVLPNKSDANGNYILRQTQLDEIKGHIDFLTKQITIEVDKIKDEMNREIDKLNTWVSIWIAVIGFLGIFIPIVINVDTSKSAERAIDRSDEAYSRAEKADLKLAEMEINVKEVNKNLVLAEQKADKAKAKSDSLHLVYAIDKLDVIEPQNLQHIRKEDWLRLFKKTLLGIKNVIEDCKVQHDGDIVKESLLELGLRLTRIALQKFMNQHNTELISDYILKVRQTVDGNYNQTTFDDLIIELGILSDSLA